MPEAPPRAEFLAGIAVTPIELSRCTLLLAAPAPDVLATHVTGMGTLEMVERVIAFGNEMLTEVAGIQIFHDFSQVSGYRAEARRVLVDWGVQKKTQILGTHVLFRSKVVAMGVSLATALLREQLTGYSRLHDFEAARHAAIAPSTGAASQ